MTSYYKLDTIKAKLHIDTGDSTQDDYINKLGEEADSYINLQISIHATTPIAFPDKELIALSAKLASAEFLMWNSPDHPRALYDDARKDVQAYIKAKYGQTSEGGTTANTFSKKGGMTGNETGTGRSP